MVAMFLREQQHAGARRQELSLRLPMAIASTHETQ